MSEYRETIKNLDKVRGYVRDMYIYGFRTRREFGRKSARTYDNERRRIESWLGEYIKWDHSAKGKSVCISVDSAHIEHNPLFSAWKSKSFTDNDITLHFLLLDILADGKEFSAPELTELLSSRGAVFELQTVRGKLREYEKEGILKSSRAGKSVLYSMSGMCFDSLPHSRKLLDAAAFFSEISVAGYVGSTILDEHEYVTPFRTKHHFIAHTLDDGVALELMGLMKEKRACRLECISRRSGSEFIAQGVPLGILTSVQTGRRYVTLYVTRSRKLTNIRLDSVLGITPLAECEQYDELAQYARRNTPRSWGVSFDGIRRKEQLFVKLHIDEKTEQYILRRIEREGRSGELLHIGENTYLYSVEVFDANEAIPWIRTFIGRIISLECSNREVADRFYYDMQTLANMYKETE